MSPEPGGRPDQPITRPPPEGQLEIQTEMAEGHLVVRLVGELDCATAPQLREALDRFRPQEHPTLVFDLSALEFIDSSGLHQLVVSLKRQREVGGDVFLRSPTPQTSRILDIVGLSKVFTVM